MSEIPCVEQARADLDWILSEHPEGKLAYKLAVYGNPRKEAEYEAWSERLRHAQTRLTMAEQMQCVGWHNTETGERVDVFLTRKSLTEQFAEAAQKTELSAEQLAKKQAKRAQQRREWKARKKAGQLLPNGRPKHPDPGRSALNMRRYRAEKKVS